jgi:hypothetical protein
MAVKDLSKESGDMSKYQLFEQECSDFLADMEKKMDSASTMKNDLMENYKKFESFISQEKGYKEEVLNYKTEKLEAYEKFVEKMMEMRSTLESVSKPENQEILFKSVQIISELKIEQRKLMKITKFQKYFFWE